MVILHTLQCSIRAVRLQPKILKQSFRYRLRPTLPCMLSAVQPFSLDCKVGVVVEQPKIELEGIGGASLRSSRRKVRQHVNPLTSKYQQPVQLEEGWLQKAFAQPHAKEFIIDIGSAKGSWAIAMCENNPDMNILGLEIRRPMVEMCLHRKCARKLNNIHFLSTNANVDLDTILANLNGAGVIISTVTIQFPDPHFKHKHKKRRLVNEQLVLSLATRLKSGTHVFIQSDIEELEQYMLSFFLGSPYFSVATGYDAVNLVSNKSPFAVQTEREIATLNASLPVFRMLFVRNDIMVEN